MLPSKAIWMSLVWTTTWDHVDIHRLHRIGPASHWLQPRESCPCPLTGAVLRRSGPTPHPGSTVGLALVAGVRVSAQFVFAHSPGEDVRAGELAPPLIYRMDEGDMPHLLAPHYLKKTGALACGVGHESRKVGPALTSCSTWDRQSAPCPDSTVALALLAEAWLAVRGPEEVRAEELVLPLAACGIG